MLVAETFSRLIDPRNPLSFRDAVREATEEESPEASILNDSDKATGLPEEKKPESENSSSEQDSKKRAPRKSVIVVRVPPQLRQAWHRSERWLLEDALQTELQLPQSRDSHMTGPPATPLPDSGAVPDSGAAGVAVASSHAPIRIVGFSPVQRDVKPSVPSPAPAAASQADSKASTRSDQDHKADSLGSGGVQVEEDDDLKPYAQPAGDDQYTDLRKVRLPRYLRECLDYMYKPIYKDPEYVEAALEAVEQLIRRGIGEMGGVTVPAEDLHYLALPLAVSLVHLGSNVHNLAEGDKYDALRQKALIALITMAPFHVVDYLAARLFGDDLTILQRMALLETLEAAAFELSALPRRAAPDTGDSGASTSYLPSGVDRRTLTPSSLVSLGARTQRALGSDKSSDGSQTVAAVLLQEMQDQNRSFRPSDEKKSDGNVSSQADASRTSIDANGLSSSAPSSTLTKTQHDEIIRQRVEAKTRRWGQASQPAPVVSVNRFGPVAALFYSALMSRLEQLIAGARSASTADRNTASTSTDAASASVIWSGLTSVMKSSHELGYIPPYAQDQTAAGSGTKVKYNMVDGDAAIYARFLHVLASIVHCSGPFEPATLTLASSLLQLVLHMTRYHPEIAVRRASLFAVARVVMTVPQLVIASAEYDHSASDASSSGVHALVDWLSAEKKNHLDPQSAQLATFCLLLLHDAITEQTERDTAAAYRPNVSQPSAAHFTFDEVASGVSEVQRHVNGLSLS